jgi:hypothetical protein
LTSIFGHFDGLEINLENVEPNIERFPNIHFAGLKLRYYLQRRDPDLPHYRHAGAVVLATLQC